MGGVFERDQSAFAKISEWTSPSQPSFTPSTFSKLKKPSLTGVCRTSLVDGGLLIVLPGVESGGGEEKP